jgi:hypothetical protein
MKVRNERLLPGRLRAAATFFVKERPVPSEALSDSPLQPLTK